MASGEPIAFASPGDWSEWLDLHHATRSEIVLKLYRKESGIPSVTWEQAVIEALAYGWIDGVRRPGGETFWLQRFSPRRPRSSWSQKNRDHAEKLIADGRMRPAGQLQVDNARQDGRWGAAYSGGKGAEVPADFLAALADSPEGLAFYQTLNAKNRFAIYYRLTTAKRPETRAKRIADYVAMLGRGERFHP